MQDKSLHRFTNVFVNHKKKGNLVTSLTSRNPETLFPGALTSPSPPYWGGEQRQEENVNKLKFLYNLQPTDKHLRQIQSLTLLQDPCCLNVNALLEGKITFPWQ